MQTLGQRLRDEREKRGFTIPELSLRTRIPAPFFEAIEADKPEEFPGRFFYRSFLRQYAELLELPESVVQAELERSNSEQQADIVERASLAPGFKPEVPPLPTGRVNVREETRRLILRLCALVGVLILCSVIYFVWQRWGQRWFDEGWRAIISRPAKSSSMPKPAAPPAVAPTPAAQPPQAPAPDSAAVPVTPAETLANPPASQTEAKADAMPAGVLKHGKIEIRASGICWVGGWRDGKPVLSTTLHAGDTRVVEGGGLVRLQFGSSGDVAVKVDGAEIRRMGGKGESRTLEYNDGAYRLLDRMSAVSAKP